MSKERFASSVFTDFHHIRELYRSQAGVVYRAVFKYDDKEYVLKERKMPELGKRKDIMNEVKLLLQLSHPNVVRCEGWFRDEKRNALFIVLEFCESGDLNSMIEMRKSLHKPFEEHQVWFIFHQLCLGLRHLHENGIIHRDLKALNIMCARGARSFKIGDLGVSRQVSENTMLLNTFYGTPLYLSPELVESKPYNEKTDIWSLGIILYEMCALTQPFRARTLMGLAKLVLKGQYDPLPPLTSVGGGRYAGYSHYMSRCVAWMLQLEYKNRPNVMQLVRG
jgi:NIMA (never in mitosis gene a)-related kinase